MSSRSPNGIFLGKSENRSFQMYELKMEQVADVSGGWFLAVAAIVIAVIVGADELEDFGDGFVDGFKDGFKSK
jgi:hypothetical protein